MKASELIDQLQDAIRLYGDLPACYDGFCHIDGVVPFCDDWDEDGTKEPDCFVLNQHESVNSYIGDPFTPSTQSLVEQATGIMMRKAPWSEILK